MSLKVDVKTLKKSIARNSDNWVFANKVLYDLCAEYPMHEDKHCIVAKIWLIGRSYAAAIERRKNKDEISSDDFYYDVVAPEILKIGSDLDKRIKKIKTFSCIDINNLSYILETHNILMTLFCNLTKLEKRSLASKYLHFHCPNAFYIFDSRANTAIKKYIKKDKETPVIKEADFDEEYKEFSLRMLELQNAITVVTGIIPTPRKLDSLLLGYYGGVK